MKNVLVISSSLRNGSNSEKLALEFVRGAKVNNNVDYVLLKGKNIKYCIGCLFCQKTGKCVLKDDMKEIIKLARKADILVFASPVYYYGMSGLMKTLLDRLNPLYNSEHNFKEVYLILTAAENAINTFDKAIDSFKGFVECFDDVRIVKSITCGGLIDANEVNKNQNYLINAYSIGESIK